MDGESAIFKRVHPPHRHVANISTKGKTQEETYCTDFNTALQLASGTMFNIKLVFMCGIIVLITTMDVDVMSYLLPQPECDYELTLVQLTRLKTYRKAGTILGSIFIPLLADVWGRKLLLTISMIATSSLYLIISFIDIYWLFFVLSMAQHFLMSGLYVVVWAYIMEFQVPQSRGFIMGSLALFALCGLGIIPGLLLLQRPNTRGFYNWKEYHIGVWKSYVFLGSLPFLACATAIQFFPESPKFSFVKGHMEKCLSALRQIFRSNTKDTRQLYPVRQIASESELAEGCNEVYCLPTVFTTRKPITPFICLLIAMLAQFTVAFGFCQLDLWFPDILLKFERFSHIEGTNIVPTCEFIRDSIDPSNMTKVLICITKRDSRLFSQAVVIAFTCSPFIIWLAVRIDKDGRKFFIAVGHIFISVICLASYFAHSLVFYLTVSCLYEACARMVTIATRCLIAEIFSTTHRCLGIGILSSAHQVGILLGTRETGMETAFDCKALIGFIAVVVLVSGLLCLILPETAGKRLK